MNENNITVVAKSAQKQDEIELDLRDLLANLLLKWKTILAVLLIGAMLGLHQAETKHQNTFMQMLLVLCLTILV